MFTRLFNHSISNFYLCSAKSNPWKSQSAWTNKWRKKAEKKKQLGPHSKQNETVAKKNVPMGRNVEQIQTQDDSRGLSLQRERERRRNR